MRAKALRRGGEDWGAAALTLVLIARTLWHHSLIKKNWSDVTNLFELALGKAREGQKSSGLRESHRNWLSEVARLQPHLGGDRR